jgi:hypothetical protein
MIAGETIGNILDRIPDWNGVDVISSLFTKEDIHNSIHQFVYLLEDDTLLDEPMMPGEKCMIVLHDTAAMSLEIDPLALAAEQIEKMDFHALYLQITSLRTTTEKGDDSGFVGDFDLFKNQCYYDQFCLVEQISDSEKEQLERYKESELNGTSGLDEIPKFLMDEKKFKSFMTFNAAATLEKYIRQQYESSTVKDTEKTILRTVRAAKLLVKNDFDRYKLWESSTNDKVQQAQFMWSLDIFKQISSNSSNIITEEEQIQFLLLMFMSYYVTYSEHWRGFCFGHELKKSCDSPKKTLKFIQHLRNHKYGRDFCNEYKVYLNNSNERPLFDLGVIVPSMPTLERDNHIEHNDWFKPIDKSKVASQNEEDIFKAVRELFYKLKENKCIASDSSENLFIYRFTGYLTPQPLEAKIKWIGSYNNTLAFIFKCLYTKKDGVHEISKPKYSKLVEFFTPRISNGSALADSLDSRKKLKIMVMLKECGFVNIDPSKIK